MGGMRTRLRHNRLPRQVIAGLGFGLVVYCLVFIATSPTADHSRTRHTSSWLPSLSRQPPKARLHPSLLESLTLTQQECRDAFPGLTLSVDDVVAEGPFEVKDTGDRGPVQGKIQDGKIYIINAQRRSDLSEEMLNSRTAALHQLYRAVITSPEPIPDTVFSINFQDQPFGVAMGYSRPADPHLRGKGGGDKKQTSDNSDSNSTKNNRRSFLMPHFSFWSWPLPQVGGTFDRAAAAIDKFEATHPHGLRDKIPRAAWRGTVRFGNALQPDLRRQLVRVARGKDWADVEPLNETVSSKSSKTKTTSSMLPIERFCAYRYVLHTEGVAYSGRFQFLQMCRSVTISPPILWQQHTSHLLRPVFSDSLILPSGLSSEDDSSSRRSSKPKPEPKPLAERTRRSWPVRYPASEANIVFVAHDWSDLEQTVAWLEAHPDVADGIARRQRELFASGGYFSPAAEACYWRALIRGWSSVARADPAVWERKEGVRFEQFSLTNQL